MTPARTKPPDSGNSTEGSSLPRWDPKSQLILHIVGAAAVYLWKDPSRKSISASGNANKFSAKEGQFISAASANQSMAWRSEQVV